LETHLNIRLARFHPGLAPRNPRAKRARPKDTVRIMERLGIRLLFSAAAAAAVATSVVADGTIVPLDANECALHVLNRLAFGPRPGDAQRVVAMGVTNWIEQQLHPNRIADGAVDARLMELPTLHMSSAALVQQFEIPLLEARKQLKAERATDGGGAGDGDTAGARATRISGLVPPENRPRRIVEEMTEARLIRAVSSERQLNEVMVDFWMNHFNVDARKGLDRIFIASFERDVIRPRIWGRFEDLLLATAQSPAMLVYLDNARSAADADHRPPTPGRFRQGGKGPTGLNENYARELLELHTLGVDGGYTQTDVTELARVLTGWSIALPRAADAPRAMNPARRPGRFAAPDAEPGSFLFRERLHDVGTKTVLGRRFGPNGGMEEGEAAIRMLAHHPSTAHHIAYELCRRLVADEPPSSLVDRAAGRFLATGGDLTETVRVVVTSPEFFDPRSYRAKVKSPFEYAVSAVRAAGGSTDGRGLGREVADMGEPLYLCQPPTGYSDASAAWVNSGALLARLNFALALTSGRIPGTVVDGRALPLAGDMRAIETGAVRLVGESVSSDTVRTIAKRLDASADTDDVAASTELLAGLLLGSPEFQRR
jgi:uncharacterized protein (DUF1800 family)